MPDPSSPTPVPATTARELRDVASLRSWAEGLVADGGMNAAVGRTVVAQLDECAAVSDVLADGDTTQVRWLDGSGYHYAQGVVTAADGLTKPLRVVLWTVSARDEQPSPEFVRPDALSGDYAEALAWFRANLHELEYAEDGLSGFSLSADKRAATIVRAALAADEEPPDLCHCGRPEFLSDDPVFAQFMGTKMCAHCIDNRCDAYPGSCDAPLSSPPVEDATTEVHTEYRVTVTRPDGQSIVFDAQDFQAQFWREHRGTDGYPPAVVESRTVSTTRTESSWEEEK